MMNAEFELAVCDLLNAARKMRDPELNKVEGEPRIWTSVEQMQSFWLRREERRTLRVAALERAQKRAKIVADALPMSGWVTCGGWAVARTWVGHDEHPAVVLAPPDWARAHMPGTEGLPDDVLLVWTSS